MLFVEKSGDLFNCRETCLAHCVSADFCMGKGIALEFKKRFNVPSNLIEDSVCVRQDVETLKIYHLVTKAKYYQKPTYQSLRLSLEAMKKDIIINNFKTLAMPKIGCGLDRLSWDKVKALIIEILSDTEIEVTIFSL
jgi:O-acetyl-ADP-ribose deacetylase (regulator of RNase III)